MSGVAHSIGLVGDGDEIDFIEELETILNIRFNPKRLQQMLTLGELYDHIVEKLGNVSEERKGCHSAIMFRKLRSALEEEGVTSRITPSMPLDKMISDKHSMKAAIRKLSTRSGLSLQIGYSKRFEWLAILCTFTVLYFNFIYSPEILNLSLLILAACAGFLYFILSLSPTPYPCDTLRDLINRNVHTNFSVLTEHLEATHPGDIWNVLQNTARDMTGLEKRLGRDTKFF